MKKTKSGRRASPAKRTAASTTRTASGPEDFDEYLATIPESARTALIKMRAVIKSVLPPETTETISYGIPAFKLEKMVVWFGGFSTHCGLYPTAAVLDAHRDELKSYKTSKGTVQFPLNKPLPITLIKKLVKARLGRL